MFTEPSKSPDQWADVYRDGMPTYEAFAHRIERLIEELLKKGPDYVQVEARAKSVDSFVAKLARRPGKYLDPLKDMHDLAGVRIICYYLSDVARVGSLIEDEFTVDSENSRSREERSDPDRFGYESDHYVVSCSSDREALPEWNSYRGMRAEIQVRTVLQHAWAAIDHKLAYKRGSEVPNELRRQLSRVSALLEVGDEQFEAARSASERLDASYDARARAGNSISRSTSHRYMPISPITMSCWDLPISAGASDSTSRVRVRRTGSAYWFKQVRLRLSATLQASIVSCVRRINGPAEPYRSCGKNVRAALDGRCQWGSCWPL